MTISIIICCYNSVHRLSPTLDHLANQELSSSLEIILVDNLSTDSTADFAIQRWNELGSKFPMNIVVENQPGLSYARLAGAKAANGEFLIFCDDDNSLSPQYSFNVAEIFQSNPEVGIIGGCGLPVFDKKPSEWLMDPTVISKFAVGPQAAIDGLVDKGRSWVYGAGMAIRRELFFKLHALPTFLTDRKGKALTGGGDVELCLKAVWLGYRIYYSSSLKFEHHIPESRASFTYLWRMAYPNVLGGLTIKAYKVLLNGSLKYYETNPANRLLKDLISNFVRGYLIRTIFQSIPWQKKILSFYGYCLTAYILIFKYKITNQIFREVWIAMSVAKASADKTANFV